jgi:hypothetical protein
MKYFHGKNILMLIVVVGLDFLYSCKKQEQAIDIDGTWYESIEASQNINGGNVYNAQDSTVYTFTGNGKYFMEWNLFGPGTDTGTYRLKGDSLYLFSQMSGYKSIYFIAGFNNQNLTLKSNFITCIQNCDTSVVTDYLHR